MKTVANYITSRAICFYSGFHFMMRTVALWLDSEENGVISSQEYISTLGDHFYYLSDAVLIGLVGLFIFNKSEK